MLSLTLNLVFNLVQPNLFIFPLIFHLTSNFNVSGSVIRPGEIDPFMARLVEQRMMMGQQALQRQMNVTATQKPAPNVPFYPRGTPIVTPHQNVLRPPVVNNTNENMNFFGRGGIFVPPPQTLRGILFKFDSLKNRFIIYIIPITF